MFRRPTWLCLHFASCVATQQNATFFGVAHPGGGLWPPNSNSAEIFVQSIYPPSFIVLFLLVRKLSCWQTHPHTNPQTHPQTNRFWQKHPMFFAMLRRWVTTLRSRRWRSHTAGINSDHKTREMRNNTVSHHTQQRIGHFRDNLQASYRCDFHFDLFFSFSFPVIF